ncbi:MAG: glycosyltransferase family 9 protein [Candidatus Eremiobacteraeota bacterium]|nr:glycosyltransferase family 9 protein [Candidatus Eremiobacteraeota bacterium]
MVRVDGIGDALACAPLVAALRDAGHEVGALLSTRNRDAFAARAFARTHVVERIPWPRHGTTPATRVRALGDAKAAGYDVALVASEESDAYAFARDAGVAQRIGFINGWQKPLKSLALRRYLTRALVRPASAAHSSEHEVDVLFRLGAGLHDESEPTEDLARLRPLVLDATPPRGARVLLQIDAKYTAAGLTLSAFGDIAAALRAAGGEVVAAGADEDLGRVFAARTGVPFVPTPTVAEWKAAIASARVLIAPDSGAVHVAGMTGTPSVVLFPRRPHVERDALRWQPWAAPSRALIADGVRAHEPHASDDAPLAEAVVRCVAAIAARGDA